MSGRCGLVGRHAVSLEAFSAATMPCAKGLGAGEWLAQKLRILAVKARGKEV
jgi:hypothetical protein